MQLKITRSQRQTALAKTAVFIIDARVEFTAEELSLVNKYKLGSQMIYNSEASKRQQAKANVANDGTTLGGVKGLAFLAMAALQLNISINSLQRGQHIECKDLDEVLGAEDALMTACRNLRAYLDTAVTFDGREVIVDFSSPEPAVVPARTPTLLPPSTPVLSAPDTPHAEILDTAPAYVPAPSTRPSASDSHASAPPFDDVLLKLQRFWGNATPAMRALVCVAAVAVAIILYQVL